MWTEAAAAPDDADANALRAGLPSWRELEPMQRNVKPAARHLSQLKDLKGLDRIAYATFKQPPGPLTAPVLVRGQPGAVRARCDVYADPVKTRLLRYEEDGMCFIVAAAGAGKWRPDGPSLHWVVWAGWLADGTAYCEDIPHTYFLNGCASSCTLPGTVQGL